MKVTLFFFFFFQAEDGIRDRTVTGVQTCALPISGSLLMTILYTNIQSCIFTATLHTVFYNAARSEERRVGKECRSRWWRYHYKKKVERMSGDGVAVYSRSSGGLRWRTRSC